MNSLTPVAYGRQTLMNQATEFYAQYSAERLRARAYHLHNTRQLFNSPRVTFLADAAFLALHWKSSLTEQTCNGTSVPLQ